MYQWNHYCHQCDRMISVSLFFLLFWCESFLTSSLNLLRDFPGGSVLKNPPTNAKDVGSIPGLGRSPGEGNGNPHRYSCLGNLMDRGTCWAISPLGSQRIWPNLATKQQLNCYSVCFMLWFLAMKHMGFQPYGIEPAPPALEGEVLTTGLSGKSLFPFSVHLPTRVHGSDPSLLRGVVPCLSECLLWPSVSRPWVWSSFPCSREGFDWLCPHPYPSHLWPPLGGGVKWEVLAPQPELWTWATLAELSGSSIQDLDIVGTVQACKWFAHWDRLKHICSIFFQCMNTGAF